MLLFREGMAALVLRNWEPLLNMGISNEWYVDFSAPSMLLNFWRT